MVKWNGTRCKYMCTWENINGEIERRVYRERRERRQGVVGEGMESVDEKESDMQNAPWTRKRRPKRFVTPLDYWILPSFCLLFVSTLLHRHHRHRLLLFSFLSFLSLFFFITLFSNLASGTDYEIALNYLLTNGVWFRSVAAPCLWYGGTGRKLLGVVRRSWLFKLFSGTAGRVNRTVIREHIPVKTSIYAWFTLID